MPTKTKHASPSLGNRIRVARREARLTQRTVSHRLGISPGMLSRYEAGTAEMPLSRMASLAEMINVPLERLVGETALAEASDGEPLQQSADQLWELLRVIDRPSVRIAVLRLLQSVAASGASADILRTPPSVTSTHDLSPQPKQRRASDPDQLAEARRAVLAEQLRRDMVRSNSSLVLNYQPIVDAQTGELAGFEALLRWHNDDGDAVPPLETVSIARDAGLAEALDFWVLQEAASDAVSWFGLRPNLYVAANMTASMLQNSSCVDAVRAIICTSGIEPNQICIELVEDLLVEQSTITNLQALRNLGVRIAIDDFGTGQSNLARLLEIDIDLVKLDRSFFLGRQLDDRSVGFLKSVVELAQCRGAKVIAEGVACEADATLAQLIGCDACQGFLFSKALSAEAARSLVDGARLPWKNRQENVRQNWSGL